jgi:hypothetical protein
VLALKMEMGIPVSGLDEWPEQEAQEEALKWWIEQGEIRLAVYQVRQLDIGLVN